MPIPKKKKKINDSTKSSATDQLDPLTEATVDTSHTDVIEAVVIKSSTSRQPEEVLQPSSVYIPQPSPSSIAPLENTQSVPSSKVVVMADVTVRPPTFSGRAEEDADSFIKTFDRYVTYREIADDNKIRNLLAINLLKSFTMIYKNI